MKKILCALSLVALLVLTGCGANTLTCTMTDKETYGTMENTAKFTFTKDKVDNVNMDIKVELSEDYLSYKDTFVSSMEESFSSFKESYGVEPKITSTDKGVNISINMTRKQYDEAYGEVEEGKDSRADVKAELEEEGYTCK